MSCKICGRGSCCTSFHSLEEQQAFEKYHAMSERDLIDECMCQEGRIIELEEEVVRLELFIEKAFDAHPNLDVDTEAMEAT